MIAPQPLYIIRQCVCICCESPVPFSILGFVSPICKCILEVCLGNYVLFTFFSVSFPDCGEDFDSALSPELCVCVGACAFRMEMGSSPANTKNPRHLNIPWYHGGKGGGGIVGSAVKGFYAFVQPPPPLVVASVDGMVESVQTPSHTVQDLV